MVAGVTIERLNLAPLALLVPEEGETKVALPSRAKPLIRNNLTSCDSDARTSSVVILF